MARALGAAAPRRISSAARQPCGQGGPDVDSLRGGFNRGRLFNLPAAMRSSSIAPPAKFDGKKVPSTRSAGVCVRGGKLTSTLSRDRGFAMSMIHGRAKLTQAPAPPGPASRLAPAPSASHGTTDPANARPAAARGARYVGPAIDLARAAAASASSAGAAAGCTPPPPRTPRRLDARAGSEGHGRGARCRRPARSEQHGEHDEHCRRLCHERREHCGCSRAGGGPEHGRDPNGCQRFAADELQQVSRRG